MRRIDTTFQVAELKERFDFNVEVGYSENDKYYRTVTNGIMKNYFDTEKEVEAYLMGVFDLLVLEQYKIIKIATFKSP